MNKEMSSFLRELTTPSGLDQLETLLKRGQWGHKQQAVLSLPSLEEIGETILDPRNFKGYLDFRFYDDVGDSGAHAGGERDVYAWLYAIFSLQWEHRAKLPFYASLEAAVSYIAQQLNHKYDEMWKHVFATMVPEDPHWASWKSMSKTSKQQAEIRIRAAVDLLFVYQHWKTHGKPTYVYSPTLAQMLLHTKLDKFPVTQLHLPHELLEFSLPKNTFSSLEIAWSPGRTAKTGITADVNSIVVFNKPKYGDDRLFINLVGRYDDMSVTPLLSLYLDLASTDCVKNAVQQALDLCLDPTGQTDFVIGKKQLRRVLNFTVASIIYASMPDADIVLGETSREYQNWIKGIAGSKLTKRENREKEERQVTTTNTHRHYLGKNIRIIDRHHVSETSEIVEGRTHASPKMHWRSGHMHLFWTGTRGQQTAVVKWVEPTVVGMPTYPGETPQLKRAGMR